MSGEIESAVTVSQLATLLIPVGGKQLVLPNVTVAEIIPYTEPTSLSDMPSWFLGTISWRNIDIPLVSFEAINEEPFVGQNQHRRIAVLNGLVDSERLPFCALVTEGVPRLMRVLSDEIANEDGAALGPAELTKVFVSGERAVIPDVDFIQEKVLQLLQ
jgi:chemosensory pili system protein ChpC